MSDQIKHECGIALIRLLKPLQFYIDKYGSPLYGLNKLYLLMEKQHNRGQDGAGIATIKLNAKPGTEYIDRYRSVETNAISEIFAYVNQKFSEALKVDPAKAKNEEWLTNNAPFCGELLLGHLRYGTYGKNGIDRCHPFLRPNNWRTRSLAVAGNFNLTNVDELFDELVSLGQHPKEVADTVTVMEKIGHFLDEENERLFQEFKNKGFSNEEISHQIANNIDVQKILQQSSKRWDGGYVMAGLMGHGDAFVLRDPNGIRPVHYYQNEELIVVTSERPPIQSILNAPIEEIKEIKPGHALIIKKNGQIEHQQVRTPKERTSCSFERIYFSRGNDKDIYQERKSLGKSLCESVLKSINYDIENTVFSFIPNTAEVAYYGLIEGVNTYLDLVKQEKILASKNISSEELLAILAVKPRVDKIAIKDAKLRTFITQDNQRDDLVSHVYDTTYGVVKKGVDNLVVLDDSIVRGTTLKQSIIKILDRLGPKKIVVVSSAPQIRYPDCYGIDMAKLGDFIAFQAAVQLLKERFKENILEEVYEKAKLQMELPKEQTINVVKEIYAPFSAEEISKKIAQLLHPKNLKAELDIIYQTIEGLRIATPLFSGDWYFTGNYPTPGGNRVVNQSFINYMEGKNVRAY